MEKIELESGIYIIEGYSINCQKRENAIYLWEENNSLCSVSTQKNYVIPHVEEWFASFLNYRISLEGFPKSATDFQPHDFLDI